MTVKMTVNEELSMTRSNGCEVFVFGSRLAGSQDHK